MEKNKKTIYTTKFLVTLSVINGILFCSPFWSLGVLSTVIFFLAILSSSKEEIDPQKRKDLARKSTLFLVVMIIVGGGTCSYFLSNL